MSRRLSQSFVIALVGLAFAATAEAQYDLSWFTIDGGGALSSIGGSYQLAGTIGQPDAGSPSAPLAGGSYQLVGGFWPVAATVCTCPGDVNGDNRRNGRDVQQFVSCILVGGNCVCGDMNGNGVVDIGDVSAFVTAALAGSSCP